MSPLQSCFHLRGYPWTYILYITAIHWHSTKVDHFVIKASPLFSAPPVVCFV
jgi:hypothetical protein